jgi:hypothetical protein
MCLRVFDHVGYFFHGHAATYWRASMSDWKNFLLPIRTRDITNPEFMRHIRREWPDAQVTPDDEDFDLSADVSTDAQASEQYRKAQTRKVIRMYRGWIAARN